MGRYDVPDPKCKHKRTGRVEAGIPTGVYASTNCCNRPECIEDAKEWAYTLTLSPAHYVSDQRIKSAG